jgi:hypothetical protein
MKIVLSMALVLAFSTVASADCVSEYMAKYKAKDPSTKTMKQIERWVGRKVKDGNADAVKECFLAKAADNPNKATVAGN